jgi:hypothetical protein
MLISRRRKRRRLPLVNIYNYLKNTPTGHHRHGPPYAGGSQLFIYAGERIEVSHQRKRRGSDKCPEADLLYPEQRSITNNFGSTCITGWPGKTTAWPCQRLSLSTISPARHGQSAFKNTLEVNRSQNIRVAVLAGARGTDMHEFLISFFSPHGGAVKSQRPSSEEYPC